MSREKNCNRRFPEAFNEKLKPKIASLPQGKGFVFQKRLELSRKCLIRQNGCLSFYHLTFLLEFPSLKKSKNAKAKKEVGEQRWLRNWQTGKPGNRETGKLGNSRKCEYFTLALE